MIRPAMLMLLLASLMPGSADACTCNGKEIACHSECIQVCSPDGSQAELCGREAGKLLLSIGKDSPSWRQIQDAARVFSHPTGAVYIRGLSGGEATRVPLQLVRPFSGITLSIREGSAVDALKALAAAFGVKLDVAGEIEGTYTILAHEARLEEIMDSFCESKQCAWSLTYGKDGWTLGVAGRARSSKEER